MQPKLDWQELWLGLVSMDQYNEKKYNMKVEVEITFFFNCFLYHIF